MNIGQGNPAVFHFHENTEPAQEGEESRGWNWEWGGLKGLEQLLRFESFLMLYIGTLFPLSF